MEESRNINGKKDVCHPMGSSSILPRSLRVLYEAYYYHRFMERVHIIIFKDYRGGVPRAGVSSKPVITSLIKLTSLIMLSPKEENVGNLYASCRSLMYNFKSFLFHDCGVL